jgi:autotransporter-associated beta strand protein
MKTPTSLNYSLLGRLAVALFLVTVARPVRADLVGPYTPDAHTLFLLHFDEPAGTSTVANFGSKGGNFYTVDQTVASTTPPLVTTMLGAAAYVNGATNFNTSLTNPVGGYVLGYDFNNSGAYQGDQSGAALSADALAMTNLNIGFNGQSPFTIEALIRPTTTAGNQEIVCTDSSAGVRGFQFRITSGSLQFQFINGSQAISGTIPTTGPDAFVAGQWYHVAITYNGTIATLYWTKLDPANGAAHVLSSGALALGTTQGNTTGPLCLGNENRNVPGEPFFGSIDEVRISSVARGSGEMQFYSPLVTITQSPVSQNVDYNQPVAFSVGASSQFALSYQWRFNSNAIAGATTTAYVIPNVAAGNAGYYDCVVTNTAGYAATSSPALLVVGAANFLAHRYSFTTDTSDSIGGKWGTNYGNATVAGGALVLDGTTDTFMQLPGNLFNAANATALTVEFWANIGSNPNNVYAFAFGTTNFVIGQGIVGFNYAMYSPHNPSGQTASASPGDPLFAQGLNAPGNLDGRNVHVAVVFDPPNQTLAIYTNGVLQAIRTNFTVNLSSLNNQLSYIGKSLWAADPYLNANFDEIRLFRGALSPITIKQSFDQGPNTLLADGPAQFVTQPVSATVPVGWTATFSASAIGYLPITYQWFKNNTLVPGATNATYSFVTAGGDNGATIRVNATNTIGVTTYVVSSTNATLTVSTPPTLSWLGAANGGADNFWNTTSPDWTNVTAGGGVLAYAQINSAVFDNRGAGSSPVDLAQAITPYTVTANNASGNDYVLTSSSLTGSLNGQGSLTKQNTGKLTIDVTNNLTGPTLISGGTLEIGNGGSAGSLGSGHVTNNATLSFNRGDTALNVANAIHGSGTVRFDGFGSVTVSGTSDYTGSTLINAGILNLQSATGLGAATSGSTIASGAQLYLTANVDVAEPLTLNGAGDGNGGLRKGGAGVSALTGPVTLASDVTIGRDTGATLTLSNLLAGPYSVTAIGNGTLALNTNNTYSGGTVLQTGILNVNANRGLGTGPVSVTGAGRVVLGTGVTVTNAFTADVVAPGAATGLLMTGDNTNGTVTTLTGPITLNTLAANGGHFAGPTSSGYLNVAGPVTLPGVGSGYILLVRLGNVRFSGVGSGYDSIEVRADTTSLGVNNAIATTAVLDLAGNGSPTVPTYFNLNGFNQTLGGLKNTVGPANLGVITNSSATKATLTLDLQGGFQTFGGNLAGNLALTLTSGTQVLTGTNAHAGPTIISGGLLQLATPTLAASSTVAITNGAFLQLDFAETNQVFALVLNGVSQPAGVYNSTTSPSYLLGSGSLRVQPIATNPTNIAAVVSGNQYQLSWPATHKGWRLEAQTNSLSVGLNNNWATVSGSTTTNQVYVPINPAHGSVFFRLVYP